MEECPEPVVGADSGGQRPGSGPHPDGAPVGRNGGLDPVDLARLMTPASPGAPNGSTRWVALAIVVAMLVVLLIMGAWLAAHVNTSGPDSRSADAALGSLVLRVG